MKSWASALSEALQSRVEKVPKGWKTAHQIAKEIGKKEVMARRLIKELGSRVEVKDFRIQAGKRILKVPHYRLR